MSLIEKALSKKESETKRQNVETKVNQDRKTFASLEAEPETSSPLPPQNNLKKRRLIIGLIVALVLVVTGLIFSPLKKVLYQDLFSRKVVKKVVKNEANKQISQPGNINLFEKNRISRPDVSIIKTNKLETKQSSVSKKQGFVRSKVNKNSAQGNDKNLYKRQAYYTVQIGTFKNLKNARNFLRTIISLGHNFCPQGRVEKIGEFYALRCGISQSKQEATLIKNRLCKLVANRIKGLCDAVIISTLPPNQIKKRVVPLLGSKRSETRRKTIRSGANNWNGKNSDYSPLLKEAYSHFKNGNLNEALKLYNQILASNPYQVEALTNRGIIWQRIGEVLRAQKDLETALKLEQGRYDPVLLNALGVNYLRQSKYQKATECFLKAGDATAMINLAVLYWKRGEWNEVEKYLQKAAILAPDNPYVYYYKWLFYKTRLEAIRDKGTPFQTRRLERLAQDMYLRCKELAEQRGYFDLLKRLSP